MTVTGADDRVTRSAVALLGPNKRSQISQHIQALRPHHYLTSMGPIWKSHGTSSSSSSSKRWRRMFLALFVVVSLLGVGAWANREWLLRSIGDRWIISDPLGPADAVAVFGGGLADRPFAAAQYYQQGLVKKILVANAGQRPSEAPDAATSDVRVTVGILLKLGVPASAIEIFGNALENTHQEVLALRAWAERNDACSIIVPTEIFTARRVRWMLHRVFSNDCVIRVVALNLYRNRRDNWLPAFKTEVIKYLYYVVRY